MQRTSFVAFANPSGSARYLREAGHNRSQRPQAVGEPADEQPRRFATRRTPKWSVRSDLIKSVHVARGNSGANHQPRLGLRPWMPAMHRGAVIPQNNVAGSPAMDVGEGSRWLHRSAAPGASGPHRSPCPRSRQHETRCRARRGHSRGYARPAASAPAAARRALPASSAPGRSDLGNWRNCARRPDHAVPSGNRGNRSQASRVEANSVSPPSSEVIRAESTDASAGVALNELSDARAGSPGS